MGDRGGGCLSLSLWMGKEGGGWWWGSLSPTLQMGKEGGDRGRECLSLTNPLSRTLWMGNGSLEWGVGGGGVCCLLHCESFSSDCLPGTRQAGPWWHCPRSGRGSLCCC